MISQNAIAARVLVVIREVYEGGRAVVGERWSLLKKMKEMADRGDAIGMLRYFEECLQSDRGRRVAEKLRAVGKKTLETEEPRVWRIVAEALVEAKVDCLYGVRDATRRKRLGESFETYWRMDSIAGAIDVALRQRLQSRRGIQSITGLRSRLGAVPFVFLRYTGPGFDRIQHLLEQATEAYLLELFEASAVVARAALEVALVERWDARQREPAPGGQTGERLKLLVAVAAQRGVITESQRGLAVRVKQAGDSAAHGGQVDGSRALSALIALRRFIGEF
jgi:hypothetical protein